MENFQLTISKFFNINFGIQQFNLKLANSKNNWLKIKCCTNVQCLPIFSCILINIDYLLLSEFTKYCQILIFTISNS